MNTTLSPVTVQRYLALQGELIGLVEQDYTGLTPKLEQIIRAFEFTQIELAVYRERGYVSRDIEQIKQGWNGRDLIGFLGYFLLRQDPS